MVLLQGGEFQATASWTIVLRREVGRRFLYSVRHDSTALSTFFLLLFSKALVKTTTKETGKVASKTALHVTNEIEGGVYLPKHVRRSREEAGGVALERDN